MDDMKKFIDKKKPFYCFTDTVLLFHCFTVWLTQTKILLLKALGLTQCFHHSVNALIADENKQELNLEAEHFHSLEDLEVETAIEHKWICRVEQLENPITLTLMNFEHEQVIFFSLNHFCLQRYFWQLLQLVGWRYANVAQWCFVHSRGQAWLSAHIPGWEKCPWPHV